MITRAFNEAVYSITPPADSWARGLLPEYINRRMSLRDLAFVVYEWARAHLFDEGLPVLHITKRGVCSWFVYVYTSIPVVLVTTHTPTVDEGERTYLSAALLDMNAKEFQHLNLPFPERTAYARLLVNMREHVRVKRNGADDARTDAQISAISSEMLSTPASTPAPDGYCGYVVGVITHNNNVVVSIEPCDETLRSPQAVHLEFVQHVVPDFSNEEW